MYICYECGETFSEPEFEKEYHPYGMGYAAESWAVCPCCGGTNFDDAKQCDSCGEYFAELKEDGLCEECWKEEYGEQEE